MNTIRASHTWRVLIACQVLATLYSGLSLTTAQAGGGWTTTAAMATARGNHTATILANGQVLVVGGCAYDGSAALDSAELYNPSTSVWSSASALPLPQPLCYHTATRLANGKVLVAGGSNDSGSQATASVYDPTARTWSNTGAMTDARYDHTATLLTSGKVLVAGGNSDNGVLNGAELFDPTTSSWISTGDLTTARHGHSAVLLPNGSVLVAGGYDGSGALTSAELYDSSTGTWSDTGELATARYNATALLLLNGQVLLAGGYNETDGALSSSEVYNPSTGTWSSSDAMPTALDNYTVTMLPNGTALFAGGYDDSGNPQTLANIYVPAISPATTGTWNNTGAMLVGRHLHTATLLANGKVLVAGGFGSNNSLLNSATLYIAGLVPTTTKLACTPSPAVVGQTVTCPVTVTSTVPVLPSGSVTCKADGVSKGVVSLNNGQASCTFTGLTVGSRVLRAEYTGNSSFAASNAQVTVLVHSGVDLLVTNLALNPATPIATQTFTVAVTVKNQGVNASPPNIQLRLWPNQPTVQICNPLAGDSIMKIIGALAVGASTTVTFTGLTVATAGNKTLRGYIDSTCAIVEQNKANNQFTKVYRVIGGPVPTPDFAVTNIDLSTSSPVPNSTFTAYVTVKNLGTLAGDAGTLALWSNQATAQCAATGDKSVAVGQLDPGGLVHLTITGISAGTTAGSKTVLAFVDSGCSTTESNEVNNQLTKAYTVVARPDLIVTNITLTPANPLPNTTFSAAVTVKNQGTAASTRNYLDVWLDQSTVKTCGAEGDRWTDVSPLGVGASKTYTFTGLSSGATAGTKTFRAFIDSWCEVTESDEANNQGTKIWVPSTLLPPTVTTGPTTNITTTSATLGGTVTPNGAVTTVSFDLGTTTAYGTTVPATPASIAASAAATTVTGTASGLTCNTTYHYRVQAVNSVGTANGADVSFKTSECPPPVGVQTNVPLSALTGWTECYRDSYADSMDTATVLAACTGSKLMLTCQATDTPNTISVLAWAPRSDATFDTGTDSTTTHDVNGVSWYFNAGSAWGFAALGDGVIKSSCDTSSGSYPDKRLCWHVDSPGYRCGSSTGIGDNGWSRVVYQMQ